MSEKSSVWDEQAFWRSSRKRIEARLGRGRVIGGSDRPTSSIWNSGGGKRTSRRRSRPAHKYTTTPAQYDHLISAFSSALICI